MSKDPFSVATRRGFFATLADRLNGTALARLSGFGLVPPAAAGGAALALSAPPEPSPRVQSVEGFAAVVSAARRQRIRDFRGPVDAWTTELPWKFDPQPGLAWQSAVIPEKADALLGFVGASANLPYGYTRGNRAELRVNGARAVTFDLGIRWESEWREGDCALEFSPRRTQTPFEGYHRFLEMNGNSGVYRLHLPARMVEAGAPVHLEVRLLPREVECPTWFMVVDRRDTLAGARRRSKRSCARSRATTRGSRTPSTRWRA
jgi:hypothetical protein